MTVPQVAASPMTREQFEQFLSSIRFGIAVRAPYNIVACQCGDINCHGWRLVARRSQPKRRTT